MLEVTRTATLHDSSLSFRRNTLTQFERLNTGEIVAGPLAKGDNAALLLIDSSLRRVRELVRTGAGPNELRGFLLLGSDGAGGIVAGSWPLARAKQLSTSGMAGVTSPLPGLVAGIGVCNNEIMMAGIQLVDGARIAGVFAGNSSGNTVRTLFRLHQPEANASAFFRDPIAQMLSVRGDRALIAMSNRPEVVVADSACRAFRRLRIAADWFTPWDEPVDGLPWTGPMRPKTYAVRWHSDTVGLLLTYRANPKAQYFTDQKSRSSPVQPKGLKVPLAVTVLTAFDTRDGRVLAERVLELGWHFLSANELYIRRSIADAEATDIYAVQLVRRSESK